MRTASGSEAGALTARILLVEDAPDVQLIVRDLLAGSGYQVSVTADGNEALRLCEQRPFDLLLLDVMLPGRDGFEVCNRVRDAGFDGGILMLTARTQVHDRVEGLTRGADDYLVKPFNPHELLARIDALLRRVWKAPRVPAAGFRIGESQVDFDSRTIVRAGESVSLAAKEALLLRYFVDHPREALSREQLLASVWQDQPFIGPRTVDVHVAWLRQKLEPNVQSPRHIVTVRGEGYVFQP